MLPVAPFSFSCPTQIYFGAGERGKLRQVLTADHQTTIFVTGSSGKAAAPVCAVLENLGCDIETVTCSGEPSLQSVNEAVQQIKSTQIGSVVACGGGSVIDTAKALMLVLMRGAPLTDDDFGQRHERTGDMTLIAIPTTAGTGAEVTSNAVLGASQSTVKISLRGPALQPDVAIVDPELMRAAPRHVVLYAGLDAVTQNVEAYTSAFATPFTRALVGGAIGPSLSALQEVLQSDDAAAWSQLAWCSLTSGVALANGGLGAAHGIASVLGGIYDAPHGALCGRLLVPVLRTNISACENTPDVLVHLKFCQDAIAAAFAPTRDADRLSGFEDWLTTQGLPRLGRWGVTPDAIETLAAASGGASSSQKNAILLGTEAFADILRSAL